MKKYLFGLLPTLVILNSFFPVNAQSVKEGKITYKISYLDETLDPKAVKSMPSSLTLTFKGNKSRVDYGNTVKIVNLPLKKIYSCSLAKGKKTYREWNWEDESIRPKREVRETKNTGATKTYAGIPSTKFFIVYYLTDKDAMLECEIWSAPSLQAVLIPEFTFDGGKGLPMVFETTLDGISMRLEATQLDKTPVNDSKFILPAGYTKAVDAPSDSIAAPLQLKTIEIK